ncbi:MAG: nucleotidyltransferase [Bacteroidales bacterium]|nr:nucleotidyltransferase [Bacteroidales bacterium]MBN2755972.1 nucleotidyltransferase [Bacteroidales bacterium]
MKPTLLILAAGLGSRYGGLKQLDKIGPSGETIMDYSIFDAKRAGFGKVVFVIRESFEEDFKKHVFNKYQNFIEVDYVFQEINKLPHGFTAPKEREKPWGTGHAVLVAREKIKEPFAVINADDFYGKDSFSAISSYLMAVDEGINNKFCLMAYKLKNTLSENGSVSRGVCFLDKNNYLVNIIEHKKIYLQNNEIYSDFEKEKIILDENTPVSMNLMGFSHSTFQYFESYFSDFLKKNINSLTAEFYLPSVVTNIIKSKQGKVRVLPSNEIWFGVTYKEDRETVVKNINEKVENGIYPKSLF